VVKSRINFKGPCEKLEHLMKRRNFLKFLAMLGLGPLMSRFLFSCAEPSIKLEAADSAGKPLVIFDAHAHPDQFFSERPPRVDLSASMESIHAAGVLGCSFSAVGDLVAISRGHLSGSESVATLHQLARVQKRIDAGKLRVVKKSTDVLTGEKTIPRAVLAVEGGDCLQGDLGQLDAFYASGVRSVCLMHYTINDIGDVSTEKPKNNGLTPFGRKVVERMQDLGMVVDVAHAHSLTLKEIAAISSNPIMDSHTNPAPVGSPSENNNKGIRRMRSWDEMVWVAKTGGIVCTWPLRYTHEGWRRESFYDWAEEIVQMKSRLGIEHVALGTDGGGMMPGLIASYRDYRDLPKLAAAMGKAGLSAGDIQAYMSGNFLRVLYACVA
jgi:microsomal dipeptidase-like Zn-dependent dipeptidase